jgi:hypothetical protein
MAVSPTLKLWRYRNEKFLFPNFGFSHCAIFKTSSLLLELGLIDYWLNMRGVSCLVSHPSCEVCSSAIRLTLYIPDLALGLQQRAYVSYCPGTVVLRVGLPESTDHHLPRSSERCQGRWGIPDLPWRTANFFLLVHILLSSMEDR